MKVSNQIDSTSESPLPLARRDERVHLTMLVIVGIGLAFGIGYFVNEITKVKFPYTTPRGILMFEDKIVVAVPEKAFIAIRERYTNFYMPSTITFK